MAEQYTIGRLARTVGLSRSTLLYYDRLGLLRADNRSEGNYRLYSAAQAERLRRICTYREMGIPLSQIGQLVDRLGLGDTAAEAMLEKHLESLEREIESLRMQQRQVVLLLEQITSRTSKVGGGKTRSRRPGAQPKGPKKPQTVLENDMITKQRWVEIMHAAGLSDDDMHNWHHQFERLEPEAHQEFLESLGIEPGQIKAIREHSRS